MFGMPFSTLQSTCDFVTSPRPPSLIAYSPLLGTVAGQQIFPILSIKETVLSEIAEEPNFG
jgi:hypothetical protein